MIFLYILLVPFLYLCYCSIRFANRYKLYILFGQKGCGKTTLITKKSMYYLKRGWDVYCTEHIPGTRFISSEEIKDIGKFTLKADSVLFIDEIGMIWDNRDFKSFAHHVRDWFKLQRHYRVRVYGFSQHFDIDLKLRNLTDGLYIGKSYFNCISCFRKVRKVLDIIEASSVSESRIADNLIMVPFIIPGSSIFTWMPKYYKFFDSFAVPNILVREFPLEPFCEYQLRWYHKKHFRVQLHFAKIKARCLIERLRIKLFIYCSLLSIRYPKFGDAPLRILKAVCRFRVENR